MNAAPAAGLLVGAGTAALLRRMAADLNEGGALRPRTAVAMYAGYTLHGLLMVAALRHDDGLALPSRTASVAGGALLAAGTSLCAASMRRFTGPGQVTGTSAGPLVTGGAYRVSRNPQYTGYLLALTGAALARRSAPALVRTGAMAVAYRVWVPVEEGFLHQLFGTAYDQYRARTPRWCGRPRPSSATSPPT